jgi:hypothetical protein
MKSKTLQAGLLAGMILTGVPAFAELPSLENSKVWAVFYYSGVQTKGADFGLDTSGKIDLIPIGKNRDRMSSQNFIPVLYQIEDVKADGKKTLIKLDPDSMTSPTPATDKPTPIVITGKTEEGNATYELYFEPGRGSVLLGGRIIDKGTLVNPRFFITATMPKEINKKPENLDEKAFEKKVGEDELILKLLDGKKQKVEGLENADLASPEFAGTGLSQVEFAIDAIGGREFSFLASPNSKLTATNKGATAPFWESLVITWEADTAKDPQGKARLAITVK